MVDRDQVEGLGRLDHVWQELHDIVSRCASLGRIIAGYEERHAGLVGECRVLYGRLSPIVGAPIIQWYGRQFDVFQHILGQPSLSAVFGQNAEDLWLQLWGAGASAIGQAIGRLEEEASEGKPPEPQHTDPVRLFDSLKLHPRIVQVARALFVDGHYAQAIFEAFKAVNNMVKDKSGLTDLDGKSLMSTAFSESRPLIKMSRLGDRTERDEQEGFKFLFMGSTLGIRNPKAHRETAQSDPLRTLEYLALASLLAKRLDEAEAG